MRAIRSSLPAQPPHCGPGPRPRRRPRTWLALGAVCLAAACAAQVPAPSRPSAQGFGLAAEAALRARIDTEIGAAACTSDEQCRLLPIGHKACGGPEAWKAWSAAVGREHRLRELADELAALQRQRIQAQGLMSNCRYEAEPAVSCLDQHCVLRPHGDAK